LGSRCRFGDDRYKQSFGLPHLDGQEHWWKCMGGLALLVCLAGMRTSSTAAPEHRKEVDPRVVVTVIEWTVTNPDRERTLGNGLTMSRLVRFGISSGSLPPPGTTDGKFPRGTTSPCSQSGRGETTDPTFRPGLVPGRGGSPSFGRNKSLGSARGPTVKSRVTGSGLGTAIVHHRKCFVGDTIGVPPVQGRGATKDQPWLGRVEQHIRRFILYAGGGTLGPLFVQGGLSSVMGGTTPSAGRPKLAGDRTSFGITVLVVGWSGGA